MKKEIIREKFKKVWTKYGVALFIAVCIIAISAPAIVYSDLNEKIEAMENQQQDEKTKFEDYQTSISNNKSYIDDLEQMNEKLEDQNSNLESKYETISKKYNKLKKKKEKKSASTASAKSTQVSEEDNKNSTENSSVGGYYVHITNTGDKYYSAGCQHLSRSDITVTLQEAEDRGLTPCSRCNP